MSDDQHIAHYTSGGLLEKVETSIAALGKTTESITVDELAPLDEFHIGGRTATEAFLDQFDLTPEHHLLDVGCGLGGSARFIANQYKCRVTGIDLTPEFVETGNVMSGWVGLEDRVRLDQGSALSLPYGDYSFDGGYMLHVGMNIKDKTALFADVCRVVKTGALFGVFDVMCLGDGETSFPVPWASSNDTSFVATPDDYKQALQDGGFDLVAERNRRDFAVTFFEERRLQASAEEGPPPMGLHLMMGNAMATKMGNVVQGITAGIIGPVELIGRKR